MQFIPHQLQRQTVESISSLASLQPSHVSNSHPGVIPGVNSGLQTSGMHPLVPSGAFIPHPTGYGSPGQTIPAPGMPPQQTPVVIRAAPAVYAAPPVKTKPKIEEPRITPITFSHSKPVVSSMTKVGDKKESTMNLISSSSSSSSSKPVRG